jgi:hypothetical protein
MSEPEANPYGVDLAIGASGDLVINSAGALTAVGRVQVMAQTIQLRLRTALGDLALHPLYGSNPPIGAKMNPEALAANLNGELQRMVLADPRFQSATIQEVQSPINEDSTAMRVSVLCVLSGGKQFTVEGLPVEARVTEVQQVTIETAGGEADLESVEEEAFFADESEAREIAEEQRLQELINGIAAERT